MTRDDVRRGVFAIFSCCKFIFCKIDKNLATNMQQENDEPSLASILNRPILKTNEIRPQNIYSSPGYASDDDEIRNYESSDSSSGEGGKYSLLKKAIGVDPEVVRSYDVKLPPTNGSEYLLAVRYHNKKVPKVVIADPSLIQQKIRRRKEVTAMLQNHSVKAEENREDDASSESEYENSEPKVHEVNAEDFHSSNAATTPAEDLTSENFRRSHLPSLKWENNIIDDFVQLRAKINRLRDLIELKKVIVTLPENVKLPEPNSPVWQRFCLGTYLSKRVVMKPHFPHVKLDPFLEEFFSDKPELLDGEWEKENPEPAETGTDTKQRNISTEHSADELEEVENSEPAETCTDTKQLNTITEHDSEASDTVKKPIVYLPSHLPLTSILINIDQRSLEGLIKLHLGWYKSAGLIHSLQAKWIYALLVCVQEPLEPNVMSDIREIAKKSISLREKLFKFVEKDSSSLAAGVNVEYLEKYVASLNLVISLVSRYFRQKDLCSDYSKLA